jgi:hypothetical protein
MPVADITSLLPSSSRIEAATTTIATINTSATAAMAIFPLRPRSTFFFTSSYCFSGVTFSSGVSTAEAPQFGQASKLS